MLYEVEQKYPVDDLDLVEDRLLQFGAIFEQAVGQLDRYFSHPGRDFACTDVIDLVLERQG